MVDQRIDEAPTLAMFWCVRSSRGQRQKPWQYCGFRIVLSGSKNLFGCLTLPNEFSRPFSMGPQVPEVNLAEPITREVVTTEGRNARYSLNLTGWFWQRQYPLYCWSQFMIPRKKPQKQSLFSCFLPSDNREPVCMQGCFFCVHVCTSAQACLYFCVPKSPRR